MAKERVYVDACCWVQILANQDPYGETWKRLLQKAEKGGLTIVTSTLTLVEVQGGKAAALIGRSEEEKATVARYFEHDFIEWVSVSYYLGVIARDLIWDYRISHKDAIHVASAIQAKVPVIFTADARLITHSEKATGKHRVPIIKFPEVEEHPQMAFPQIPDVT